MSEVEKEVLYWFLKECVGNVQCRWGPCALGPKRNDMKAQTGRDPYIESVHGSDIGMALAAMKYYKGNWKRTSENSNKDTKDAQLVKDDGAESDDEAEVVTTTTTNDNADQVDEEASTGNGKRSRKKVKTEVYHACWNRHLETATNSIYGKIMQDPDFPQDETKKILVDPQNDNKEVTEDELEDRFEMFNKFMQDRLILEKSRKKRKQGSNDEAGEATTVTTKKKMTCVTNNENFFNGSRWKWSEAITASEKV